MSRDPHKSPLRVPRESQHWRVAWWFTTLPEGLGARFGDGWMSNNARDLAQIAARVGGFDARRLAAALALAASPGRTMNVRTVERVLGELSALAGAVPNEHRVAGAVPDKENT